MNVLVGRVKRNSQLSLMPAMRNTVSGYTAKLFLDFGEC